MKTYKWETIKEKAGRELSEKLAYYDNTPRPGLAEIAVIAAVLEDKTLDWRGTFAELKAEVRNTVMRWDVRCAQKLIDLTFTHNCPIVPIHYRNKHVRADMDESGDWVIWFED